MPSQFQSFNFSEKRYNYKHSFVRPHPSSSQATTQYVCFSALRAASSATNNATLSSITRRFSSRQPEIQYLNSARPDSVRVHEPFCINFYRRDIFVERRSENGFIVVINKTFALVKMIYGRQRLLPMQILAVYRVRHRN